VREEVADAGDQVGEELKGPIAKLVECVSFSLPSLFSFLLSSTELMFENRSFSHVQQFLQMQAHRPFLKRYLKRDEILRQISGCDKELNECLEMFGVSLFFSTFSCLSVF
jgi:abelson tyrosine-protein kinase 1